METQVKTEAGTKESDEDFFASLPRLLTELARSHGSAKAAVAEMAPEIMDRLTEDQAVQVIDFLWRFVYGEQNQSKPTWTNGSSCLFVRNLGNLPE